MLKIISWNVNGIRSVLNKNFSQVINDLDPDILLLQEIKIDQDSFDKLINDQTQTMFSDSTTSIFAKYHTAANCAVKKGYSGVAILSKNVPDEIFQPPAEIFQNEGRLIGVRFGNTIIFSVYVPNTKSDLSRLAYREKDWGVALRDYLNDLQKKYTTIIGGDFNVAHAEIDLARPKDNLGKNGFTQEERNDFTKLLSENKLVDTFRQKYPLEKRYTWWSARSGARERGIGWRIDYCLLDKRLGENFQTNIYDNILGSDHCPIELILL